MKPLLILMLIFCLCACQNAYKQHYREIDPAENVLNNAESCREPEIVETKIDKNVHHDYYQKGYVLIGYSRFSEKDISDSNLIKFAQEIGACLVLKSAKSDRFEPGPSAPVRPAPAQTFTFSNRTFGPAWNPDFGSPNPPTRSRAPMPARSHAEPPHKFEYNVEFFVKVKSVAFGALLERVPDDLRKRYSIDDGVLVGAVMYDQPAYKGGIMEGDVITAINNEAVGKLSFSDYIAKNKSTLANFSLIRDGKSLNKKIAL